MSDGNQSAVIGSRYQRDIGSWNVIDTSVNSTFRTLGNNRRLVVEYKQRLRSRSSVTTAVGCSPGTNNLVRLWTVTRNDCLIEVHSNRFIAVISSRYISRLRNVVAAY